MRFTSFRYVYRVDNIVNIGEINFDFQRIVFHRSRTFSTVISINIFFNEENEWNSSFIKSMNNSIFEVILLQVMRRSY